MCLLLFLQVNDSKEYELQYRAIEISKTVFCLCLIPKIMGVRASLSFRVGVRLGFSLRRVRVTSRGGMGTIILRNIILVFDTL